jgi:hypothetical protein
MAGAARRFIPVQMREEEAPEPVGVPAAVVPRLEIRLVSGIVITMVGDVASESLRRVLAALAAQ